MIKIFLFAHDPGGGRAVAKVAEHLRTGDSCRLDLYAAGPSLNLYRMLGIKANPLEEDFHKTLVAASPDVLLTATSLSAPHDRFLIREASNLGIPSLALIDHWSNYRLRFTGPEGTFYPDVIGSIDSVMTEEMIADGVPPDLIVETGNPVFDDLIQISSPLGLKMRARTRCDWGATEDDFVVLYASQPVAGYYGDNPENKKYLGYTEFEVAEIIMNCLDELAVSSRPLHLIFRPHPKEERGYYESALKKKRRFRATIDRIGNHYESVLGADVVVGISSILLIEAAIMGRVAISVQPNLIGPEPLKSNISGLTWGAYSEAEARSLLTMAVLNLDKMEADVLDCRERFLFQRQAATNIARVLFQLSEKDK